MITPVDSTNTPPALPSEPGKSPSEPRLLDLVRTQIRLRHYSIRTEAQYVHWVKRFVLFHGKRHPREMGAAEVEAFPATGSGLENTDVLCRISRPDPAAPSVQPMASA